ncbi:MAG TPA: DUF2017 family protein [Cryobacterium sp.]|nr:DUF2017 family protein [Cryobacterium sp.]
MWFTAEATGTVSALFDPAEVDLLRHAVTQLADLLAAADTDPFQASADPVVLRLLPDAYIDDPEAAAEFRRFTAGSLLDRKVRNARALLETLGDEPPGDTVEATGVATDAARGVAIELDAQAVQAWLRTLTDLRLTVAERLEISPDGVQHLEGEEAGFLRDVYEWFGMVQESLVHAIDA